MKCIQELIIEIPSNSYEAFFNRVEKGLNSKWRRDNDNEREINKNAFGQYYVFYSPETVNNHKVRLFFICSSAGVKVANIVPKDVSELTIEEYNAILNEFNNSFIKPVAKHLGYNIIISSDKKTLNDILKTKKAREALISFSDYSNKTTGTAHPCDRERWYNFVTIAFRANDKPDSHYLKGWFIENGWEPEKASDIIIEFEQEWGILEYYQK